MVFDTPEKPKGSRLWLPATTQQREVSSCENLTRSPEFVGAKHGAGLPWSRYGHLIQEGWHEVFLDPIYKGCLGTTAERKWRFTHASRSCTQVTSNQNLTLRVSELVGLRIFISDIFPGDAAAAAPGP